MLYLLLGGRKMQSLQTFLDILTKGRKLHICVHDISGLLKSPERYLPFEYQIHSKKFCNIAKFTEQGLDFCLNAKDKANNKAVNDANSFCGHCPWGLFEVAQPIVQDKSVQGIIYVGNFIIDEKKTKEHIIRTSKLLNVSPEPFFNMINECENLTDISEAFQIAEIVKDYLLMLPFEERSQSSNKQWLVRNIKHYANEYYEKKLSLKTISKLYFVNEKYIGRLFKNQVGMSFHQYLNEIRLKKAEELLINTDKQIIDIGIKCGFENVSYFNRIFKQKYGITPTVFREVNRKLI